MVVTLFRACQKHHVISSRYGVDYQFVREKTHTRGRSLKKQYIWWWMLCTKILLQPFNSTNKACTVGSWKCLPLCTRRKSFFRWSWKSYISNDSDTFALFYMERIFGPFSWKNSSSRRIFFFFTVKFTFFKAWKYSESQL